MSERTTFVIHTEDPLKGLERAFTLREKFPEWSFEVCGLGVNKEMSFTVLPLEKSLQLMFDSHQSASPLPIVIDIEHSAISPLSFIDIEKFASNIPLIPLDEITATEVTIDPIQGLIHQLDAEALRGDSSIQTLIHSFYIGACGSDFVQDMKGEIAPRFIDTEHWQKFRTPQKIGNPRSGKGQSFNARNKHFR